MKHILTILLFLLLIGCDKGLNNRDSKTLNWMVERSGIHMPENASNLNIYNNHEWGVISKFSLDSSSFIPFISENHLEPLNTQYFSMHLLNNIENIELNENYIVDINKYLFLSDCKPGNSWTVLANLSTYEIWFEVLYPDTGGDIEECEKAKRNSTVIIR